MQILDVENHVIILRLDLVVIEIRIDRPNRYMIFASEHSRFAKSDFRVIDALYNETFFGDKDRVSPLAHRNIERSADRELLDIVPEENGRLFSEDIRLGVIERVPMAFILLRVVTGHHLVGVCALGTGFARLQGSAGKEDGRD